MPPVGSRLPWIKESCRDRGVSGGSAGSRVLLPRWSGVLRAGCVLCSGGEGGGGVAFGVLERGVAVTRYRRVVVKLSGEALAGQAGTGVDPASLGHVAREVLAVRDLGVQVAVVVGGGNYFRGRMAEGWGISRAEADNIGMLGTVMNALMLRGALTAMTDIDVRVMTAVPMQSVAEPFIRLRALRHLERGLIVLLAGGIGQPYVTTDYPAVQRALELDADALLVAKRGVDGVYDSDPNLNPDAVRYSQLTYDEALAAGVRIMDTSAFVLANEQGLTMHVFDVAAVGVMGEICEGVDVGTRITRKT
jgi:uridylate kinase